MFTVTDTTPNYTSPLIGNGEITTILGPTGYHTGFCPEWESINRTIFWAGRRLNTPTHALVRFGRLDRSLKINGIETQDARWQQAIDYDRGQVVSQLDHGTVIETTRTLACLNANILVFHSTLENQSDQAVQIAWTVAYALNRVIENRLFFPYMSHFDFRPGYEQDIAETDARQIQMRAEAAEDFLRVRYQINQQLGEVCLGWSYDTQVTETDAGGIISHTRTLEPGEQADLWTWVVLSDRQKFTHFPGAARIQDLVEEHQRGWADFWNTSAVELGDERLEALRKTSLYAIRCSASPWSVPPAYLATHWEGRTFHDELYPFLALMSSGHDQLAARIPGFRLGTLPVALARSGYQGANFPWETLESGEEGGPLGHWMDERFHIGQFAVTAWQHYLYTQNVDELQRFYPLLRACAERFVHDVLIRDADGRLATRLVTDFDEAVYPLANGIFTICAAVRSLDIAAQAAAILGAERGQRDHWRQLADELRAALPIHETGDYYRVSDDGEHWHIAQAGMIYPFSVDIASDLARETLTQLTNALRTEISTTAGSPPSYDGSHWFWSTALLATGFFYQGRAEEGLALLKTAPNCIGPFFAPNEQKITRNDKIHYQLPWFTTSAGAFVYALNAMIAHVNDSGTVLLGGVPESLEHLRFQGLLVSCGVRVSGTVVNGQLTHLTAQTNMAQRWTFHLPAHFASSAQFADRCSIDASVPGMSLVICELAPGDNVLAG